MNALQICIDEWIKKYFLIAKYTALKKGLNEIKFYTN